MRRRVFLALFIGAALSYGAGASARAGGGRQAPPSDRVTVEEFKALHAAGKVLVLDVRYELDGKIKGAVHVPLGELEARLAELPREREVVTYCS